MSFVSQNGSSTSDIGNVMNELSSMIGDMGGTTGAPQSGANATLPQQSSDSFGSSQGGSELNALGLILEGLGELLQMLGNGQQGDGGANGGAGGGNGGVGGGNGGVGGGNGGMGGNPKFNSFQASDTGDPHLSFTGTEQGAPSGSMQTENTGTPAGGTVSHNWDDMQGEQDLLHAKINGGRYQLSTDVTTPINSNGVTLNKSAQITYGSSGVNVSNSGQVTVSENGTSWNLGAGQSINLTGGLDVSESADGKTTTVGMNGPHGQNISTTISQGGVDAGQNYLNINSSGNNVRLGGYMVDQAAGTHTENEGLHGATPPTRDEAEAFLKWQRLMQLQSQSQSNLGSLINAAGSQNGIAQADTFDPNAGFMSAEQTAGAGDGD